MKRVLVIDDDPQQAQWVEEAIDSSDYDAECYIIVASQPDVLISQADNYLRSNASPKQPIEFLVLDIRLSPREPLGGIKVYEELVNRGLRNLWEHDLVLSIWGEHVHQGHEDQLLEFLDHHNIPRENLLPKYVARREHMIKRIKELSP